MAKKELITRSELARRAGVTPATATRLCQRGLKEAVVGKRVDATHPLVVKYLKKRAEEPTPPAVGVDPLYESAIEHCRNVGRYSPTAVQKGVSCGWERAKRIHAMMDAAGIIPAEDEEPPIIEEPKPQLKPPRVIKGHRKKNENRKTAALNHIEHGQTVHQVPDDIQAFADMTLREIIERFGSDYAFVDWLKATKAIEDINEKRLKNAQTRGELVHRDLVERGIIEPIESAHIKLLTDGAKTIARRVPALHDAGETVEDIEKYVSEQLTSFIRPVKAKVRRCLKSNS